ncbi:hypothetical protein ACFYO2_06080 [Streptomyces sp. NPDC006602]|uniref:hypothetical protein n=1 Tax=Streptomyces sp. NPDC006602 TaxID=3364751 RepID=UPI0036A1BBDD
MAVGPGVVAALHCDIRFGPPPARFTSLSCRMPDAEEARRNDAFRGPDFVEGVVDHLDKL